ncbi:MAG: ThuA domain-containing protein [Planctomycetaceae bacterium]
MTQFFFPALAILRRLVLCVSLLSACRVSGAEECRVLFLGDNGHHRPVELFHQTAPVLQQRGIELSYTDRMEDLTSENLKGFDGVLLYANIDAIDDAQANVLLDYVAGGKGFIPIHCATYCWRNNAEMAKLMGARFLRHGGTVFGTQIAAPSHPVMVGFSGFTSWDETYIHHLHNEENRTVLEYRIEGEQAEGNDREPWTWVRTHGKGRVFYTAWGHDERTWRQPGFSNLLERGIRWACGRDVSVVPPLRDRTAFAAPKMTELRTDVKPFEYVDVGPKIPNYTPGSKWGVQGAPRTTMQLPLSVEESMKHYVLPEGMVLRRYADERNFDSKPLAMNWDERGRLWICETLDYPNELGRDRDRIRICEDTDGDNVADRFTIFAEGLSIPTSIVIIRGGAIVQNATETLYLKDTDGDDKADQKSVLIKGWAAGDTHGGVSNLRYGLDNWIWGMQGYNESTPEYNGHRSQSFRMGFWRFKLSQDDPPVVTDLEFVRSTNNNTWGLGISEEGLIFGSTANHNPSTFVPIFNRYYEKVRGWAAPEIGSIADTHLFKPVTENIRQVDQFGGYTAGAGHALYTARTFPQQWWNQTAFVCEPTGHLIGTFVLRPDGAGFKSASPTNLIASDDEWSSPIVAEVGPDGAVWVIDWYNYIIQHNPTPQGFTTGKGNAYETELRDRRHGRIYRVVPLELETSARSQAAADSTAEPRPLQDRLHTWRSLANATNVELVEVLKHPSMIWRLQAQRLLIERQAGDVLQPLLTLLADESVDEIGLNVGAIHAVHTLHGLGYMSLDPSIKSAGLVGSTIGKALSHSSSAVRRNVIAVLPRDEFGLAVLLDSSAMFLRDESDAQVLLQLFLTLSEMPTTNAGIDMVLELASTRITDQRLADAATVAVSVHCAKHLRRLWGSKVRAAVSGDGEERGHTIDPARAVILSIVRIVAEHFGRTRPGTKDLQEFIDDITTADGPLKDKALEGLIAGLPQTAEIAGTETLDAAFVKLFRTSEDRSRIRVVKLANICGSRVLDADSTVVVESLLKILNDTDASMESRITAARDAVGFQSESSEVLSAVLEIIRPQTPPDFAAGLIEAAGLSTASDAGELIVGYMQQMTPSMKASAVRTLLTRPATTTALLAAIKAGTIDLSDLTLDQKQALRVHPDADIRNSAEGLLAAGGSLPDADREKVLNSLLALCEHKGDIALGRAMFVKHCSRCHMHGTEGRTIGPNLTGMAVHPKHELLTHIIDPSRSVEGNFRIYTVVKKDGLVLNGMLSGESRTAITLIDAEAREHHVAREDIEELVRSRKSVMPEGFEKQMSAEELTNLLEFLTDKGRYMPISLDRYATAVSTKSLFDGGGDEGSDRMVFSDWAPKMFKDVPFILTDPRGKTTANIILLYGPHGKLPPTMPRSVVLPCNSEAKAIHLLSGVGGWSFPATADQSVSMVVRLHYRGGHIEDIKLINGVHFADYIRHIDVPESEFAWALGGQQIRRVVVTPGKPDVIDTIELIKGPDSTAPIVMAVTVERIYAGRGSP